MTSNRPKTQVIHFQNWLLETKHSEGYNFHTRCEGSKFTICRTSTSITRHKENKSIVDNGKCSEQKKDMRHITKIQFWSISIAWILKNRHFKGHARITGVGMCNEILWQIHFLGSLNKSNPQIRLNYLSCMCHGPIDWTGEFRSQGASQVVPWSRNCQPVTRDYNNWRSERKLALSFR